MGRKDSRPWRKLVKKLRRKRKRQEMAKLVNSSTEEKDGESSEEDEEEQDELVDDYHQNNKLFLTEEEWNRRNHKAELILKQKLEKEKAEEKEKKRIRDEWEQREAEEREKIKKQEEDYNQYLDFLCGDIETPPTRFLMPQGFEDETLLQDKEKACQMFVKTGTCKFLEQCKMMHPSPILSQTLLIPNFFTHFLLERNNHEVDLGLEYEKSEVYKEFLEFYNDVVPEFRKYGTLIQFKVCCNFEPHLKGNVYLQYQNIREAVDAFRAFNGRYYNGRQLSIRFTKIDSWKVAICYSFLRGCCVKGSSCNYLHVFRNPTKEFVEADRDFKPTTKTVPNSNSTPPPTPGSSRHNSCNSIPITSSSVLRTASCSNSTIRKPADDIINVMNSKSKPHHSHHHHHHHKKKHKKKKSHDHDELKRIIKKSKKHKKKKSHHHKTRK